MLVIRTCCSTDHKGRPNHRLTLVAKIEGLAINDALAAATEAMNKDVVRWMAVDIAIERIEDLELTDTTEAEEAARIRDTMSPAEIAAEWANGSRWEMRHTEHREFVERYDDDVTTTVYHFVTDELLPITT